jgi:thioredoxin 1
LQFLKGFIKYCRFVAVIKYIIGGNEMVEHLTTENFEKEVINSDVPVVIDFYADWCGPCQMMAPVFESLDKGYEGKVKFLKLDTQAQGHIAAQFGVQSIPTLAVIRDGKVIGSSVGFMDEDSLKQKLNSILEK